MGIYLDFNATHPPDQKILLEAMQLYFKNFANPSGRSKASQEAEYHIEKARKKVAEFLWVQPNQIVFTSGSTESAGICSYVLSELYPTHKVAMSSFEHPAISENFMRKFHNVHVLPAKEEDALSQLQKESFSVLAYSLGHGETGIAPSLSFLQAIPEETFLLADASQIIRHFFQYSIYKQNKQEEVQAIMNAVLTRENSALFFSSHKIGAGHGSSALVLPRNPALQSAFAKYKPFFGGNQENEMRPGTSNFVSILALAKRLSYLPNVKEGQDNAKTTFLFEKRIQTVLQEKATIVGYENHRIPGTTLLYLPHTDIDFLLMALDMEGISVSTGTSCKSRSRTPSPTLLQMGFSPEEAIQVIRFSYDYTFSEQDMEQVLLVLEKA